MSGRTRGDGSRHSVPERYVLLCLRIERHFDGFVDAYIGPPKWKELVAAEEPVAPNMLREEALALVEALPSEEFEPQRERWLAGQLRAVECVTASLAGEPLVWGDEVEWCLGVRPTRTDTAFFEDVHRRLDAALAGNGPLRDRYNAWDERNAIPSEKIVPALAKLKDVLGPRAHALAPMPAEESVVYETVTDKPWVAYNWYQGHYHSRVDVNADLPISIALLTDLAAHEAYPGHHTERAAKEAHLLRDLGHTETSVAILSAPEALVSEGIAMNALEQALGPTPYEAVADALSGLDVSFDPAEVHEVHQAELALFAVGVNAAFMLHEDGATPDEAEAYMREWGLESDQRAKRTVAFLTAPTSRAYISAYTDGRRLCRSFADRAPENFTRLLTEQLTTADLVE
jgi:hypothetical protein